VPPESPLTLEAGAGSDWFIAPDGSVVLDNATSQLTEVAGDFQLRAKVSAPLASTFDAAALVVRAAPDAWGKLALERSPQGEATIVSVVTHGVSDDANAFPVDRACAWLRISRAGETFAFHASDDGLWWTLIRWFTFTGAREARAGFLVQSPTGEGLVGRFDEIEWSSEPLADLRNGS
jgi:regulation of enolase protein 1 (concanavalin A-like superfamily)